MNYKILKILNYILLPGILILLFLLFYPRSYDVPQIVERDNVKYWDLPTGSRIAYTYLPAKGFKKTYPVIFLQGGPGGFISKRTIASLAPLTENGYDLYFYDQVGSGHSERLENITEYTADRHKRDLEEIIKKTGAPKVILIGQSWGAILATLFIADNAGKVEKAIFTGPGPIQPVNKELANLIPPDSLHLKEPVFSNAQANREVNNVRSKLMMKWAVLFACKLASDTEADQFQTLLDEKLKRSTVCDTSLKLVSEGGAGFYAQVMTIQSLSEVRDPRLKIKNPGIPVLVMKGQCDNQKWGYTNEYLQLFPNHKLVVVSGAGHSISTEQPGIYLNTILDFLNE